jgi:hypothetical protein
MLSAAGTALRQFERVVAGGFMLGFARMRCRE